MLDLTYVDQLLLLLLLVALPTEIVVSYAGHSNLDDQAAFSTNSWKKQIVIPKSCHAAFLSYMKAVL